MSEIRDYFGDGSDWGVDMRYSVEDAPAGTAGSVKMAEQQLGLEGERLLIINGDALTDADLSRLVDFHEEKGSEATMVIKSVENPSTSASSLPRRTAGSHASCRSRHGGRSSRTPSTRASTFWSLR